MSSSERERERERETFYYHYDGRHHHHQKIETKKIVRKGRKENSEELVVAQFVEWLLPIPEVRSSNPVIDKIYIEHLFTCLLSTVLKRRK